MTSDEVLELAVGVLGSKEDAEHWMNNRAIGLQGQKPVEVMVTAEGIQAVRDLLTRIDFGVNT